jgi:hypothetical protein
MADAEHTTETAAARALERLRAQKADACPTPGDLVSEMMREVDPDGVTAANALIAWACRQMFLPVARRLLDADPIILRERDKVRLAEELRSADPARLARLRKNDARRAALVEECVISLGVAEALFRQEKRACEQAAAAARAKRDKATKEATKALVKFVADVEAVVTAWAIRPEKISISCTEVNEAIAKASEALEIKLDDAEPIKRDWRAEQELMNVRAQAVLAFDEETALGVRDGWPWLEDAYRKVEEMSVHCGGEARAALLLEGETLADWQARRDRENAIVDAGRKASQTLAGYPACFKPITASFCDLADRIASYKLEVEPELIEKVARALASLREIAVERIGERRCFTETRLSQARAVLASVPEFEAAVFDLARQSGERREDGRGR